MSPTIAIADAETKSMGAAERCAPPTQAENRPAEESAANARIYTDPVIAEWWQRAQSFCMDDPHAAEPYTYVLSDEMGWDADFTQLAILEYKKFMLLCRIYPDNMTPSVDVDTVWHLHLMYTRSYQRFCREALDTEFLHHEPSSGGSAQEQQHKDWYAETLNCYVESFGNVPPYEIWGKRVRTD